MSQVSLNTQTLIELCRDFFHPKLFIFDPKLFFILTL